MDGLKGRLRRDFRENKGVATPALIVVWLAAGGGMIAISLHMGLPAIDTYSGTVASVHSEPGDGLRVKLVGSPFDFFFSDTDYSQLPDVRAADNVAILAEADQFTVNDQNGAPVIGALAVESRRGTWTDSIFGDAVAPFTPSTWPLHEALRWLLFVLGSVSAAFGLASVFLWIRSRPAVASGIAPDSQRSVSSGSGIPAAVSAAHEAGDIEPRSIDRALAADQSAVAAGGRRAALVIGWMTLAVPTIVDLSLIAVGGSNACRPTPNPVTGWGFVVLLLVPITYAAGGITTLVLASGASNPGTFRKHARALGVIAIGLALVSVPVNFLAAISWALCF